ASGAGYGAIGAAASAVATAYMVQQAGGAANLTNEQRAVIVGAATLLGGLTAGLAGQDAQAGALAAQNEALNNGTQNHDLHKDQEELKKELSQERAKLYGEGEEIIGYDAEGDPITVLKGGGTVGLGSGMGSRQGTTGNAPRLGGGSTVGVDAGNGANDWNDASKGNGTSSEPVYNSQGAARAATNSGNWSSGSLSATVQNIVGSNPDVTYTTSGKTIYTNPATGMSVVYDNAGNYYRVQNGAGQYLDQSGNAVPNNVPLIGPNRTTQTGVPSGVRNGLTHFNNTDPVK
ncbi:VENN motif pre-toxin domain-containing protein, partial [Trinickia caryophylli]|uniref:VENN motif pre-toxin domain-containing protein n=1 Tax=Trinickia caryophylli TaxID=28094 RepID=UPI0030BAF15C